MTIVQALLLGIVQGLTEFIPVSSSAHLVLVPWIMGWKEADVAFDAVIHLGTLVAVVAFFWRDLWRLGLAWLASVRFRSLNPDPDRKLAWLILVGTVPAAVLGFLLQDWFESLFGQPGAVAVLLLVTGTILVLSERLSRREREMSQMGWLDTLAIGLAQAAAIAPGISRSGATIAAGLFRGLTREAAARYSFLLGTPIILGAGLLKLRDLFRSGALVTQAPELLIGFLAAAVTGYVCIQFLLRYVQRNTLTLFAVYCWLGGVGALALVAFHIR